MTSDNPTQVNDGTHGDYGSYHFDMVYMWNIDVFVRIY